MAAHVMMYGNTNLKSRKCSLTLDASKIIQRVQQTDFPPDAITTFSSLPTTGLVCK
jgi:hypothetical protein